jgi:hypothetical protein
VTTWVVGPTGLLAVTTGAAVTWPLADVRGDLVGTADATACALAQPRRESVHKLIHQSVRGHGLVTKISVRLVPASRVPWSLVSAMASDQRKYGLETTGP